MKGARGAYDWKNGSIAKFQVVVYLCENKHSTHTLKAGFFGERFQNRRNHTVY